MDKSKNRQPDRLPDAPGAGGTGEGLHNDTAFLAKVLDTSLNGVYVFDLSLGTNIFANRQYTRLTGYSIDILNAMSPDRFLGLFHPDDASRIDAHLHDLAQAADEDALEIEYRFRTLDGRWIWCHSRDAVFKREPDGTVRQFIGTFVDVTDRAESDLALAQSQVRYRELVHNSNSAIICWRSDGTITFVNEYAQAFFGWRSEEMLGNSVGMLLPDQASSGQDLQGLAGDIVEHPERYVSNINENICRDGRRVWVNWTNRPILDSRGQVTEILAIGNDITPEKRAESTLRARERQQAAVAGFGQFALGCNELQRLFDVAVSSICEVLGVEYSKVLEIRPGRADMLLRAGMGWQEGLVGQAIIGCGGNSQASYTLANKEPVIVQDLRNESRFRGPSLLQQHQVVSGVSCAIAGPGGEPWGVLGAHSRESRSFTDDDVNFLVAIANALAASIERESVTKALREADRHKNDFLATLAHELRNPLAPICNAVEILNRQGRLDPASESARDIIDRQLKHMTRLIEDLLDVSRITHGRLELRREVVELAAVVQQALETTNPAVQDAGHELIVSLPLQAVHLHADPIRLAQVLVNLINNACKYTGHGGRIVLSAEPDGADIVIRIIDSGSGISTEYLPRVFDWFSQAESALDRSMGGLGVGLSLARQLVTMHEGNIEARSRGTGRGSEFTIRLPVVNEVTEPPSSAVEESPIEAEAAVAGNCVLVVDDNRDIADSLAFLLQISGYQVHTAYDGLDAVDSAGRLHPDAILLDIGMPNLNGYEACRRIREQPGGSDMIIFALTGWGQDSDRQKAREAGFDDHLVKPIDPVAVQRLLADRLAGRD